MFIEMTMDEVVDHVNHVRERLREEHDDAPCCNYSTFYDFVGKFCPVHTYTEGETYIVFMPIANNVDGNFEFDEEQYRNIRVAAMFSLRNKLMNRLID